MPETETEMLARLKLLTRHRTTIAAWDHELSPDDQAAIRWLLVTMERYRTALELIERDADVWLHSESRDTLGLICTIGQLAHATLVPDPPATAETEVQS